MSRIIYYAAAYLICLVAFTITGGSPVLEGLIFLTFIATTLLYTFSIEGMPSEDLLRYPEAFKYKTTRVNTYGNGMLVVLVIAAILIGLNFSLKLTSNTVLIMITWPVILIASYVLAIASKKRENLYSTWDYVNFKLDAKADLKLVKLILENHKKTENIDEIVKMIELSSHEKMGYDANLLRETAHAVSEYKNASKITISYGEIKAADTKIVK